MTNVNSMPPGKIDPLTKQQILKLHGGKDRGEEIFVRVNRGPEFGYVFYDVFVRNQWRSQRPSAHPEGSLRLASKLWKGWYFRYDIASGKCLVRHHDVSTYSGTIGEMWGTFPALLQPRASSEGGHLMRKRAHVVESRERLVRAIRANPGNDETVANLLAEELKLPIDAKTDELASRRIMRYMPYIEPDLADSLRETIVARGPSDLPAQSLTVAPKIRLPLLVELLIASFCGAATPDGAATL